MGEYANFKGERIKIGTCESLYYLRADQLDLLTASDVSREDAKAGHVRFRFPFPDEDHLEPGTFDDYGRGWKVPGWKIPGDFQGHGRLQFRHDRGYLLMLDCPEGENAEHDESGGAYATTVNGVRVARNRFNGQPRVVQQKYVDGELWTVVECGGCGAQWRLPRETAEQVAVRFRAEADRMECRFGGEREQAHGSEYRAQLHAMADRILAGYIASVPA